MKLANAFLCAVSVAALAAAPALAQEGMPPTPKPGPEHQILQQDAGAWDATVEMWMAPGQPPAVSKGTETNTLCCGGLWLYTDFNSDMMGAPFQGHGVMGYDPAKKKYVGTWVDSMSVALSVMENTYDAATKTMTGFMEGPDPSGKMIKMKMVNEWKDAGETRVFTMSMPGPDAKDVPTMRITYKRKK